MILDVGKDAQTIKYSDGHWRAVANEDGSLSCASSSRSATAVFQFGGLCLRYSFFDISPSHEFVIK